MVQDTAQILAWLNTPDKLQEVSVEDLQKLTLDYPYCELFHWFFLKRLCQSKDVRFKTELSRQMIYISNRKLLYHFLYDTEETERDETINLQFVGGISNDYFTLVEKQKQNQGPLKALASRLREARMARQKMLDEQQNMTALQNQETLPYTLEPIPTQEQSSVLSHPENGSPENDNADDDNADDHNSDNNNSTENAPADSATKILDQSSNMDVEGLATLALSLNAHKEKPHAVQNPKLQISEDMAQQLEQVAKIALSNKDYQSAYVILSQLYLKYPEKNAYFADQIKYIEMIIINNKK